VPQHSSQKSSAPAAKQSDRAVARPAERAGTNHTAISRQPQVGNRAMGRLLSPLRIQPKLVVAPVGDPLEREADRVADAVVRAPSPVAGPGQSSTFISGLSVQRKCAACEHEQLQRKETDAPRSFLAETIFPKRLLKAPPSNLLRKCAACESAEQERQVNLAASTESGRDFEISSALEADIVSLQTGGRPLQNEVRELLEPRLGVDLGNVRVHTDRRAAETASALNARAFTVGHNIAFAPGQFAPQTSSGRWLIAHEVTHVLQQTGRTPIGSSKPPQSVSAGSHSPNAGAHAGNRVSAAPASVVQLNVLDDALALSPSALLGTLWFTLNKTTKSYVIDKVIDFASTVVEKFPGKLVMGGFWVLFREGLLGFYAKLKAASVEVKINAIDKLVSIIVGTDFAYMLAFVKGLVKGFFIDGALGIFIAIYDVAKALGKLWDFIKGIGEAIGKFPQKIQNIVQGFFSLGESVAANFWPAVVSFVTDSDKRNAFLATVTAEAKGLAKQAGEKLAESILSFFAKPQASAEIGETIGAVSGQVLWEVVLAVFTAGGGAAVTAAKASLRTAARMLEKLLGRIVSGVLKIVAEVRTVLGAAAKWIKGAIKSAKGKLGEIGGKFAKLLEDVGEFFATLLRNCHESKLVCELGEGAGKGIKRIEGASDAEHAIDQLLKQQGRNVEPNLREGVKGAGRQGDRLIDGVLTELKTVGSVKNTTSNGLSAAISSRIMDGRGQAAHIIVDIRGQAGITEEIAKRGIIRAYGADAAKGSKIQSIRIIGPDFDIKVPRIGP
jgi:hypothetical protein